MRADRIGRIILAGDSLAVPVLEEEHPQEMEAIAEAMKMDIHASDQNVLRATIEKLQEQEGTSTAEGNNFALGD